MNRISQEARKKQAIVKYSLKNVKSKAAKQYGVSLSSVKRWCKRYDGTWESLKDRPHMPHSHPNRHTPAEERKIKKAFNKCFERYGWDGVYLTSSGEAMFMQAADENARLSNLDNLAENVDNGTAQILSEAEQERAANALAEAAGIEGDVTHHVNENGSFEIQNENGDSELLGPDGAAKVVFYYEKEQNRGLSYADRTHDFADCLYELVGFPYAVSDK